MKRWKQARNWSGSSRRRTRLNVSWLGGPCSRLRKPRRNASLSSANSAMSTAVCPPHKTVHSAIIRISSRSCRPALPVRGSSSPSKQAMNPSMSRLPPTASKTPSVEAIASQHASSNALVKLFQMQFPCEQYLLRWLPFGRCGREPGQLSARRVSHFMQTFLEFEKPIAELEGKIEELR